MALYFKDISRLPSYSEEEISVFFQRLHNGDKLAKNYIVCNNLKLVISIAKKYVGLGVPLLDLIGEGNKGLFRAVEKFDPNLKCQFSTYATIWIKQYILRGIAKQRKIVRPAINTCYRSNKISRILKGIQKNIPDFALKKLLEKSGIKKEDLQKFLTEKENDVHTEIYCKNIDNFLKDDPRSTITPFDNVKKREISRILDLAISKLNSEEKTVIDLRFNKISKRKTLEDIGKTFNVTRERIRQIESSALQKLKKFLNKNSIESLNDIL